MFREKKAVLIVDDEEDITWSISRHLRRNEALLNVQCVSSGVDALDLLAESKIDLIISDIKMPGLSGLELLRIVSEEWPETKVIIMTAFGSEVLENEVERIGTPFYIEKPFDLRYLRKLVFEALNLSSVECEGALLNSRIKDMLAFSCQTRRTSQLTFNDGIREGTVYLQRGEIVHAECGELEGESALFDILDWEEAHFRVNPDRQSAKRTIRRNWQSLLDSSMID